MLFEFLESIDSKLFSERYFQCIIPRSIPQLCEQMSSCVFVWGLAFTFNVLSIEYSFKHRKQMKFKLL